MAQSSGQDFSLDQYVIHHVENAHEWHLPFLPTIPLPAPMSLHLLMLILASLFLLFLFTRCFNLKDHYSRGRWTNALEAVVLFIRNDIAIETLGEEDGKELAPVFCTFFFLIVTLNLMGLIPLFSTATANFNVTGGLMLAAFSYMTFGAIKKNGFKKFCGAFIPSDIPVPILIILVPIEILGFFIKNMVLMVRLFANLLGGHFVLLSLIGMTVVLGSFVLPAIIPVVLFVYILEIFVAFLQAYIFTILAAVFISQVYHPEH